MPSRLPRARGIIFDTNREVLMVRNARGHVYFPGGGFEPGVDRDLSDTLCREVMEETGVTVDGLVHPVKGAFPSNHHYFVGFSSTAVPLPMDPEGEVVACAWVPAAEVDGLLLMSGSHHMEEDRRMWRAARQMLGV